MNSISVWWVLLCVRIIHLKSAKIVDIPIEIIVKHIHIEVESTYSLSSWSTCSWYFLHFAWQ